VRRAQLFTTLAITITIGLAIPAYKSLSASASTSDVLTSGSTGGTNVAVENDISSSLSSGTTATISSDGSSIGTCTGSNIAGTVTSNPAAPSAADLSVSTLTFSGCTEGSEALTVVAEGLPYSGTFSSSGSETITGPVSISVSTGGEFPTHCTYTDSGGLSATDGQFSGQEFTKGSSPLCSGPDEITVSGGYDNPVDTSISGDPAVFIN
jgi:hypothetical protein